MFAHVRLVPPRAWCVVPKLSPDITAAPKRVWVTVVDPSQARELLNDIAHENSVVQGDEPPHADNGIATENVIALEFSPAIFKVSQGASPEDQTVRGSRSRKPERGHQRRGRHVPGRVVYFFQVQLDRFSEVRQRIFDRVTLAGHVYLQALRDVPVFFLVQCSGQGMRQFRHALSIAIRRVR